MATLYPTAKDDGTTLPNPTAGSARNSPSLAAGQDNQNDAIIAIETKLGTGSSTAASGKLLRGTGAGASAWDKDAPTGTIVGTSDSQTLTNKILTSPTINSPTITNATLSTDSITGYTTGNTGSIYGVQVTTGSITSGLTNLTTTGSVTAGNSLTVSAGTITAPTGSLSSLTLTNPYKFSAYQTLSQTITSGGYTVKFDTERFDTGNNYNNSTYTFTAPVNGFYFFNAQIDFTAVASKYSWIGLAVNGTEVIRGNRDTAPSADITTRSISVVWQLTAAQTVTINAAVESNVTTEATHCWFQGFLVSAT